MYAVMWSEHCSYKSSRIHLRRFPTEAPWVLVGPGENAGVVDVGDGIAVAHPHREPQPPVGHRALPGGGHRRRRHPARHLHHGRPADRGDGPAALRPARRPPQPLGRRGRRSAASPATATRSACPPSAASRCSTRPTAATRSSTCSASACCPADRLVLGRATGVGNLAVLLGSSTGRDGIGGVSVLASAGFGDDEADAAKRPSVQVGDPFEEKRLIEACLDAARRRPRRRHPGPRRRRPHVRHQRDGGQGRRRAWTSTSPTSRGASRAWSRSR